MSQKTKLVTIASKKNSSEKLSNVSLLLTIGKKLEQQEKYELAYQYFSLALNQEPTNVEALVHRGRLLRTRGQLEAAIFDFDKALLVEPNNALALISRGITHGQRQHFKNALLDLSKAISFKKHIGVAYFNRGVIHETLRAYNEAVIDYSNAIQADPKNAGAYYNRGVVYREIGELDAALFDFNQCITLKPTFADAYFNKSLVLLTKGNFEEGLKLYEYRWHSKGFTSSARKFETPALTRRDSLRGKVVLFHSEQGLGDTIQFIRYLHFFKNTGALLLLEVEESLVDLMECVIPKDQIFIKGENLPKFDFHCPMMSLPFLFETTVQTIPTYNNYLWATTEATEKWNKFLGPKSKPRIGISWRGNHTHPKDWRRSIDINDIVDKLPNTAELISLQHDISEQEKLRFEDTNLRCLDKKIGDFACTAGLCENLDAVITVDTSLGHLAGAIGIPTHLVLGRPCDFRWFDVGDFTPWYQNHHLHRATRDVQISGLFLKTVHTVCEGLCKKTNAARNNEQHLLTLSTKRASA